LGKRFQRCWGVDISEAMVAKAQQLNAPFANCQFVQNSAADLRMFPDESFDLIYTAIVLQHIPSQVIIKSYLTEFCRLLRPGGLLMFQLPHHIPFKNRIQPRRRVYGVLRALGFPDRQLLRLNLTPMVMNFVPENEVRALLLTNGLQLRQVQAGSSPGCESRNYYASKPERA
jgi:ubiquinone/menaquinone biosynthesis C-methylase UbiE